jgi:hypothetical protein
MATPRQIIDQFMVAYRAGDLAEAERLTAVMVEMMPDVPLIRVVPGTIIACAKCHDTAAAEYRLRRVMGRYVLLCYKNGEGCWERSPLPMCSFKDAQGVPCGYPAEARVAYGQDQTLTEDVCALHVGACLTPAVGKITVYPLEV